MSDVLAECIAATRRYGRSVAVDAVSLRVHAGEVVGLLGANGAGKTTLIRMLLGLLRPTSGEVRLFGEEPSRRTRRRLGYVPQNLGLYDDLTVRENLDFAGEAFGAGAGAGVDGVPSGELVGRLPLGLQRRVAFAEALAHRPDLMVLDEPTSGVDPVARTRLWDVIREAAEGGAGVLVTTHHMDEAQECDRLAVLAGGRLVAHGTEAEIVGGKQVTVVDCDNWVAAFDAIESAGLSAALVGRTLRIPDGDLDRVRRAIGSLPAVLRRVPATLEERFLQLSSP